MVMDIKNTFLQILEIVVRISKINTSDSLSKKTEQGIHRQTPPPRYRNAVLRILWSHYGQT